MKSQPCEEAHEDQASCLVSAFPPELPGGVESKPVFHGRNSRDSQNHFEEGHEKNKTKGRGEFNVKGFEKEKKIALSAKVSDFTSRNLFYGSIYSIG